MPRQQLGSSGQWEQPHVEAVVRVVDGEWLVVRQAWQAFEEQKGLADQVHRLPEVDQAFLPVSVRWAGVDHRLARAVAGAWESSWKDRSTEATGAEEPAAEIGDVVPACEGC